MATVPYSNPTSAKNPSSFEVARRDDFFGFPNAVQAIGSMTPKHTNPDGTIQQPTQVMTVSGGFVSPDTVFSSAGGSFFDMRPPGEIFAEMDARLNQQRQHILSSPQMLNMLERRS